MNTLNGIRAVSIRLSVPWLGAWFAEVDLDLENEVSAPSGAATLRIGASTLTGTIDTRASGRFGARAGVRVVGGAAAWDTLVSRRHFQNDAGVTVSAVVSSTAAEIGERVGALPADVLGEHFVRVAGAASSALGSRDWYVDFDGITQMLARPEVSAPADLDVLSYHPETATVELAHDEVVRPGWVLSDDRFGTVVVRDVEQTFSQEGSRATVWCSSAPQSRLVAALASAVRGLADIAHLRSYEYRVYGMAGDRVELQAIRAASGAPDLLPAAIWMGVPGVRADLTAGSRVLVAFTEGDPSRPLVRAFDASDPPVSLHLDATSRVVVGDGRQPVARASSVVDAIKALQTQIDALSAAFLPISTTPGPIKTDHQEPAKAAVAAVKANGPVVTKALSDVPSTKLSTE